MENLNGINIYSNNEILALPVDQAKYDMISLNRKSTFINLYDGDGEFSHSANTLEMRKGQDYLFLSEVMRAAELAGLIPVNSLCSYKKLVFRLAAVQTSELQTNLKVNAAKREDWKKSANQAPAAPAQAQQATAIQQNQPRF